MKIKTYKEDGVYYAMLFLKFHSCFKIHCRDCKLMKICAYVGEGKFPERNISYVLNPMILVDENEV